MQELPRGHLIWLSALTLAVCNFTAVTALPPPLCLPWNPNISLVCSAIKAGHNFLNSFEAAGTANARLQHCNFLTITPHCCKQFCIPAENGSCEQETGVCRCQGPGKPAICNAYFNAENPNTNMDILNICAQKCNQSPEGTCKTPAYVNDGFNFVCVCYCP